MGGKPLPPGSPQSRLTDKVVCTDRGQHPRARVTVSDALADGSAGWGQTPGWDVISDARPDALTLRFFCRRCRRDVRLHEDKALAALEALRQATGDDHAVLDISALPC